MFPTPYTDRLGKELNSLIDEMIRPATRVRPVDRLDDHGILIDELGVMYEAHMTIGGQQNRFNASVIRAAINVIASISKV